MFRQPVRSWKTPRRFRPRLEGLEERLAPAATLQIDPDGSLTYIAEAGTSNQLTVSLSGGFYTFADLGETITITGVGSADWSGSGTPSVSGPAGPITSIGIALGDESDTLALGAFDGPIAALIASGGGQDGDLVLIADDGVGITAPLLRLTEWDCIDVFNQVTVAQDFTLQAGCDITLGNDSDDHLAAGSIEFHAGMSGDGTLSFGGPSLSVHADTQSYRAGDGPGESGTTATVNLVTNHPSFRSTDGFSGPAAFTLRQDASITDADIPDHGQFGGARPGAYTLGSDDGDLTLSTGTKVSGTSLTLLANGILDLTAFPAGDFLNALIATAGEIRLGGGIGTGGGGQLYHGNVAVGDATLADSAGADITLNGAIASLPGPPGSLTVHTTGTTTINGSVANLASLTTDAGGTTRIAGPLSTAGAQTFNDDVVLIGNVTLTVTAIGDVTFGGAVNGDGVAPRSLSVSTGGVTTFTGAVGGSQPLGQLTTGGTTQVNGSLVRTRGNQAWNGPVSAGAATRFESTDGELAFNALDLGAFAGMLLAAGTITLRDDITAGALEIHAATGGSGDLVILNTPLIAADVQHYRAGNGTGGPTGARVAFHLAGGNPSFQNRTGSGGPQMFSLRQDASLSDSFLPGPTQFPLGLPIHFAIRSDDGDVTLTTASKQAGSHLTVQANGMIQLPAYTGANTLGSLTATALAEIRLNGDITTTAATGQSFHGPVRLAADVALDAGSGDVTFAGAIDSVGAAHDLTVNTGGTTAFHGDIGLLMPLKSLTTDGAGDTGLAAAIVRTTDAQHFGDDVRVMGKVSLEVVSGGSAEQIIFGATVNADSGGPGDLAVAFGGNGGELIFNGPVGDTQPLNHLTAGADTWVLVNGGLVRTDGEQTYDGSLQLGAEAELDADVLTVAAVDLGDFVLTVNAAKRADFNGGIGGAGGLVNSGPGVTTLAADNAYTGSTTQNAGALRINGQQPLSSVQVNGGILGGVGTTGPVIVTGGTLSPGTSPGVLTVTGPVAFQGGRFLAEIRGRTPGSHDQLLVTGPVSLGGFKTRLIVTLKTFRPGFRDRIVLIDSTAGVTGRFKGLPEGAVVRVGGVRLRITYRGGADGNDVVLKRVRPPRKPAPRANPGLGVVVL